MARRVAIVVSLVQVGCGLGLEPYNFEVPDNEREVTTGVDMKGNTYADDLVGTRVLEPAAFDRLFNQSDRDELLFHVAGQGATAFELVASLAASGGGQDPCAKVYPLGTGSWEDDENLRVEGGKFVVPIAGNVVTFFEILLVSGVDPTTEEWLDPVLVAEMDTRELAGGAFPEGQDPCDLIEAEGGTCHACERDGAEACTTVRAALMTELVPVSFDPEPDTSGC